MTASSLLKKLALATVLTALFAVAACSGQRDSLDVSETGLGSLAELPVPSSIQPRQVSGYEGNTAGSDFAVDLPHSLVEVLGDDAVFTPTGGDGLADSAFAIYPVTLTEYSNNTTLGLSWSYISPAEPFEDDYWIGLANWETDIWDWKQITHLDRSTIDFTEGYVRKSDSLVLVAVVRSGDFTIGLRKVWLSWEEPAKIWNFWPQVGTSAEDVQFSAEVSGAEPLTYTWEFGDAASPSISNEVAPTVTLGEQGYYGCSLTVEGPEGIYQESFNFRVNDAEHWQNYYESVNGDYLTVRDSACDSEGNFLTTGYMQGSGPFNPKLFVNKLSPSGELIWSKQWGPDGTSLSSLGWGIALDSSDNIYITGGYRYGGLIPDVALLLKLDNDGNCLWDRIWSAGIDSPEARDIVIAPDGSVLVSGYSGSRSIGERTDLFVMKFTEAGDVTWQKLWELSDVDERREDAALAIDANGVSYVVAGGIKELYFDDTSALLKIDADGGLLDSRMLPDFLAKSVAVEADGTTYIAGDQGSDSPDQHFTVLKLTSGGSLTWAKGQPVESLWINSQLCLGPSGQILCIADTNAALSGSEGSSYLMKLTQDGLVVDSWKWNVPAYGDPCSIAFDASGSLWTAKPQWFAYGSWEEAQVELEPLSPEVLPLSGTLVDGVFVMNPGSGLTHDLALATNICKDGNDICVTRF